MLKNLDKYDIFTIPKINRMTYRIIIVFSFLFFVGLNFVNGQNKFSDDQIKNKLDELITTANNKKKKSAEIEYQMMVEIREKFNQIKKDKETIEELEKKIKNKHLLQEEKERCDATPPLTYIKSTAWTSQNLTKDELYKYFGFKDNDIIEVNTDAEWEKAHNEKKAAFCYHKWDAAKEFGVLLNVHALAKLREKLNENGSVFRFPTTDDVKKLNEVAKLLNLNSLKIYALSSDPKQTGSSSWKMQTHDLFNFTLPALSYRRNLEDDEWHGGSAASFYCDNPNDPNWNDGLVLAELSANSKLWEFLPGMITSGDYSNIGAYVRLIYRD